MWYDALRRAGGESEVEHADFCRFGRAIALTGDLDLVEIVSEAMVGRCIGDPFGRLVLGD